MAATSARCPSATSAAAHAPVKITLPEPNTSAVTRRPSPTRSLTFNPGYMSASYSVQWPRDTSASRNTRSASGEPASKVMLIMCTRARCSATGLPSVVAMPAASNASHTSDAARRKSAADLHPVTWMLPLRNSLTALVPCRTVVWLSNSRLRLHGTLSRLSSLEHSAHPIATRITCKHAAPTFIAPDSVIVLAAALARGARDSRMASMPRSTAASSPSNASLRSKLRENIRVSVMARATTTTAPEPRPKFTYMLHSPSDMSQVAKFVSPNYRSAALKAANRGHTTILLRRTNTSDVREFEGARKQLDTPTIVTRKDKSGNEKEVAYRFSTRVSYKGKRPFAGGAPTDEEN